MKCQNCGNNNAVFHYQASINGLGTEQHLCAECAEKLGLGEDNFFGDDMIETLFNNFFGGLFASSRNNYFPELRRVMIPVMTFPRIELAVKKDEAAEEKTVGEKVAVEKDEVMSKRREANLMREELKTAIACEEFERAAELRDKICELEVKD